MTLDGCKPEKKLVSLFSNNSSFKNNSVHDRPTNGHQAYVVETEEIIRKAGRNFVLRIVMKPFSVPLNKFVWDGIEEKSEVNIIK